LLEKFFIDFFGAIGQRDLIVVGRNKRSEVPAMRIVESVNRSIRGCRNCAELVPAYKVSG
jgi:hypothetical protein